MTIQICIIFIYTYYVYTSKLKTICPCSIFSAVVVNFNENSYTVAENVGQVSVSLHIDGKFFYPVWAIVEISDGTAQVSCCTNAKVGSI